MTSNANAQDTTGTKPTPPVGFGIPMLGTAPTIVDIIEVSPGMVLVKFTSDNYPVTVNVNDQDPFTFEASNGWHTFEIKPQIIGDSMRSYRAVAKNSFGEIDRAKVFTLPPGTIKDPERSGYSIVVNNENK